jgi:uncharacterized membrane protein YfcA
MLGIIIGIALLLLGISMIFKKRKDDNDEEKRANKIYKKLGMFYLIIGSVLILFLCLV